MDSRSDNVIQDLIQKGIQLHQAGELPQAETIYRKILEVDPDHANANHLLGLVAIRSGALDNAVQLISKAIQLDPNIAPFYCNLGRTLKEMGRLDHAADNFRKALAIDSDFVDAHINLGNTLQELGQLEDAIDSFHKALAINPDSAKALYGLGNALSGQGRRQEAVNSYQKALAFKPDFVEAHNNLGNTLWEMGRQEEAFDSFQKALSIKPEHYRAHNNLGAILKEWGKRDESFASFRKAALFKPDFPETLVKLGNALTKFYRYDELEITVPEHPRIEPNSGDGSKPGAQEPEILETVFQKALKYLPKNNGAQYSLTEELRKIARKNNKNSESRELRILLLQPPIWKISAPGEKPYPPEQWGLPTAHDIQEKIEGDSLSVTYGLLSIAAQIMESGRNVFVCNLANFTWTEVENLIRYVDIDLVGITCMTFNMHGMLALSQLIREVHPKAHIVTGGPHPNALPRETMKHCQAIDTVVIGEGERTFMEIIEHLESGKPVRGIAGTAWRENELTQLGPPRERVNDLDELVTPHNFFSLRILLTSRGCPFQCTFCGSESQWGRNLKMNSVEYILDLLEQTVRDKGVKSLFVKDDTFTASRKRTLAICQGIKERNINFVWSCDTRVDVLDEEMLRALRLAGCQRLSLGVESGSPEILKSIMKKTDIEKIVTASRMARKYGFQIRFYMIAGNRGETLETFTESLKLIDECKPSEFGFTHLSYLPGTEEFEIFKREYGVSSDIFFEHDYSVFKYGFSNNVTDDLKDIINLWLDCYEKNSGKRPYSVEESLEILDRLDGLNSAHMDVAGAYLRDGQPEEAEPHVLAAIEKGYPLLDLAFNYLACIAAHRGDLDSLKSNLERAIKLEPHPIILENYQHFWTWMEAGGVKNKQPLTLTANNDFPTNASPLQPAFPVRFDLP